jgi:hypothetical protein
MIALAEREIYRKGGNAESVKLTDKDGVIVAAGKEADRARRPPGRANLRTAIAAGTARSRRFRSGRSSRKASTSFVVLLPLPIPTFLSYCFLIGGQLLNPPAAFQREATYQADVSQRLAKQIQAMKQDTTGAAASATAPPAQQVSKLCQSPPARDS